METPSSKEPLISKAWMQVVILSISFGSFVMGLLAYYTYTQQPPIPARVVDVSHHAGHRHRKVAGCLLGCQRQHRGCFTENLVRRSCAAPPPGQHDRKNQDAAC